MKGSAIKPAAVAMTLRILPAAISRGNPPKNIINGKRSVLRERAVAVAATAAPIPTAVKQRAMNKGPMAVEMPTRPMMGMAYSLASWRGLGCGPLPGLPGPCRLWLERSPLLPRLQTILEETCILLGLKV